MCLWTATEIQEEDGTLFLVGTVPQTLTHLRRARGGSDSFPFLQSGQKPALWPWRLAREVCDPISHLINK